MDQLTGAPFNLQFRQVVSARARATNFYGTGEWSDFNLEGATICKEPVKMGPLTVVEKNEVEVTLSWSQLTGSNTGDKEILAYNLYWDDNTGTPNIKLQSDLTTEYILTGMTGGLTYKFVITAQNIYGEGPESDELVLLASHVPDLIDIVSTSISGTQVIIDWTEPSDSYEPILEYDVIF